MKNGRAEHYKGRLSAAEIANGMNAATRNAKRLIADAELLFENERYPTALSIAILAIEEAGKLSILRGLSIVPDDKQLIATWRDYRTHTAKNSAWIISQLAGQGARTLQDLRPIFDSKAEHQNMLDSIKQIGFYTDCYGNRNWSEPQEVIEKKLAQTILAIARILCPKRETSVREIELWAQHLAPHWGTPGMAYASVRYHEALRAEGLEHHDPDEVRRFYGLSTAVSGQDVTGE